jgi:hypothetical protein
MRNGFAVGAERENAGSRRIRPEALRALARGHAQDWRQSKSIEAGKTGKSSKSDLLKFNGQRARCVGQLHAHD